MFLITTPVRPPSPKHLDEMLEKEEGRLADTDREVLLHLFTLLAAKGGIGQNDVVAVFLLHVGQVLGQGVGVDDVGSFDAVQDHVHDGNDISQRLFFLAVEGVLLQRIYICGGQMGLSLKIVERLTQKASRTNSAVINTLADLRLHHLDDGADQRTGGVILTAVASGVAHVLDLGFVEVDSSCFSAWEPKRSSSM